MAERSHSIAESGGRACRRRGAGGSGGREGRVGAKALAEQTSLMAKYTREQTRILKSNEIRERMLEMTRGQRRIATETDEHSGKDDDLDEE